VSRSTSGIDIGTVRLTSAPRWLVRLLGSPIVFSTEKLAFCRDCASHLLNLGRQFFRGHKEPLLFQRKCTVGYGQYGWNWEVGLPYINRRNVFQNTKRQRTGKEINNGLV
jgi:hypothetical protein